MFDPSSAALHEGIFGLPATPEQARVVLVPVPWEATVSYGAGAANGPEAILRASRKARLVIFGEGPLEAETRALATDLSIADDVLFAGYVNDPAACYAAIDLLVLSSTSEGFGNVLIEAMAHGVPVVSTDAPHGPREILDDGRFGPLVPVADPAALATQLQNSLERPIDSEILRQRADEFKINVIADKYEGLFA